MQDLIRMLMQTVHVGTKEEGVITEAEVGQVATERELDLIFNQIEVA